MNQHDTRAAWQEMLQRRQDRLRREAEIEARTNRLITIGCVLYVLAVTVFCAVGAWR